MTKTICTLAPRQLPPLSLLIDDLAGSRSPEAIADHLDVSALTVRRWIAKDGAPRAAMLALFFETRWGLSALDAQAVNLVRTTVSLNLALKRENATLQRRIQYLEAVGQFGSANDPVKANSPFGQDSAISLPSAVPISVLPTPAPADLYRGV